MAIPIAATLTLNTGRFVRAASTAGRALKPIAGGLTMLGGLATKAALAITGLTAAVSALVIRQTSMTANLVDTASKLGVGVDFLQKFRYAAEQTGVGVQTADMALQRFTRRVAEAAQGTGEAKGALLQMGIQLRGSNGQLRSTQDVLFDVADAFQNTESESEKLRLAFKLFDSEGAALVNTLDQGSGKLQEFFDTAQGLGFVLTQDAAQGVKDFDDSLTNLRFLISGLISQLTAALAPALEDLTDKFVDFVKGIAEDQGGFENLGSYLKDQFIDIIKNVTIAFANMYNVIVNIFNKLVGALDFIGLGSDIANVKKNLEEFKELEGQSFAENFFDLGNWQVTTGKAKEILEKEFGSANFLLTPENVKRAIGALETGLQQLKASGATDFMLDPISEETIANLFNFFEQVKTKAKETNDEVAEEVLVTGEKMGFTFEKLMDAIFGRDRMTKFWSVFDDEASTAIDKLRAGMQVIFGEEGLGRLRERLADIVDVSKTLEDGFVKAAQVMQDSLVEFIKTGKLSFSDLADHIKTVLIQAFVQKAIMGPLMGLLGLGGGGGGLGASLMSLFTGKATGGPVSANKPYIVGEKGPELFVPGGSGTIIPNNQMGMGATQVTYNINATDAQSFKSLVARDPEFIYAVSQAGARSLPR